MSKFEKGEWVQHNTLRLRGLVKGHRGKSALVCWVGRGKATPHGTATLTKSGPPRAFVLEGSLGEHLESTRSAEHLLRNWLNAIQVKVAYKNVHSLADIPVLARALQRNPPPFVHISCHGYHDREGRPFIRFAPSSLQSDRIYLDDPQTTDTFREAFEGMAVLFDACLLGKYSRHMTQFRRAARLTAVAGFTRVVYDSEVALFDLLVYQGLLINGWKFSTAIKKACDALKGYGLLGGRGRAQSMARVF